MAPEASRFLFPGLLLELRVGDVAAVGAVGQPFQDGQAQVRGDAEAEVRAGGRDGGGQLPAVEAAVGRHQHARPQVPGGLRQRHGEGGLPVQAAPASAAVTAWVPHSARAMTSTFGKAPAPGLAAGAAEVSGVGRGIGGVPALAVQGHQAPPAQPRPGGRRLGARLGDPLEQLAQRLRPEPLAGLAEAEAVGTCHSRFQMASHERPCTSFRMTSS